MVWMVAQRAESKEATRDVKRAVSKAEQWAHSRATSLVGTRADEKAGNWAD